MASPARFKPLSSWLRGVAIALLPALALTSTPAWLLAQAPRPPSDFRPALGPVQLLAAAPPAESTQPPVPPVPLPPAPAPTFKLADFPTDTEVLGARIFREALIPEGGSPAENTALAAALRAYVAAGGRDHTEALEAYLRANPTSRWAVALRFNLGSVYFRTGHFSLALAAWEQAWKDGQRARAPGVSALVDLVAAELAQLNARLGRQDRLRSLFAELKALQREPSGAASELLLGARHGLWLMENRPGSAFRCGPAALASIQSRMRPGAPTSEKIVAEQSTSQGTSLDRVAALSAEAGMPMVMARREGADAAIPLPAVVHWKVGHYAALLEEQGDLYHLADPTFGDDFWVSRETLRKEASGYFLVKGGTKLPRGWRAVAAKEGAKVWGKGHTTSSDPNRTGLGDLMTGLCPGLGMAGYNVHMMLVSLSISDTPLAYAVPRGPDLAFSVRYAQREANQPAIFTFWNLGQRWTSDWLSYVYDSGSIAWAWSEGDPINGVPRGWSYNPNPQAPFPTIYEKGGGLLKTNFASPNYNITTRVQEDGVHYATDSYGVEAELFQPPPANPQGSPTVFIRRYANGSQQIYSAADSATYPRRIFLTKEVDPYGNELNYTYDTYNSQLRLRQVTDALGHATQINYNDTRDSLKPTSVVDFKGRTARLAYSAAGNGHLRLEKITDTAGYESTFAYDGDTDFVSSLTTPYGTTQFAYGDANNGQATGQTRWLEVTDPYNDKERVEFREEAPGIPASEPPSEVPQMPAGLEIVNNYLHYRNAFHWDKKAYKLATLPGGGLDYTKARLYHFLHAVQPTSDDAGVTSGLLESSKMPFESRVWYRYDNQASGRSINEGAQSNPGMRDLVVAAARVVEGPDGNPTTQITRATYNVARRPLTATDADGRVTTFKYNAIPLGDGIVTITDYYTGFDLLEMHAPGHVGPTFTANYPPSYPPHLPQAITDASGQATTFTYKPTGQLESVRNALNQTVTYNYFPANDPDGPKDYLKSIVGADQVVVVKFGYDGFERVSAITSFPATDNDLVQIGYEARPSVRLPSGDPKLTLNRPLTATYPDGTWTEVVYDRMHVSYARDQAGAWSRYLVNQLGQTAAVIDPMGHITQMTWCKCGALQTLTDPNLNTTRWDHDAQGRLISKIYADTGRVAYEYQPRSGRLSTVTDAKQQVTRRSYYKDGRLASISHENPAVPTPGASYEYDAVTGHLSKMSDQFGDTVYSYNSVPASSPPLGSGRLASVIGPWANSTVSFGYDALGRVNSRLMSGQPSSWHWDSLGRLDTSTNPLGTYYYTYDGSTSRLSSVTGPGGRSTVFSYHPVAQLRRLASITHSSLAGGLESSFSYDAYDPVGRIGQWIQTPGSGSPGETSSSTESTPGTQAYALAYDPDGRLKGSLLSVSDGKAVVQTKEFYAFDAADNLTGTQTGNSVTGFTPTSTNSLWEARGGGPTRVAGTLSEWARVTINGQPALTLGTGGGPFGFEGSANLPAGTSEVSISATDASGNVSLKRWQITTQAGAGQATFEHDANGNLIRWTPAAGQGQEMTFDYDALDRCVAITKGTHRSEFAYAGSGARVRITEKENGAVQTSRLFVNNEERDLTNGNAVLRRFHGGGETRYTVGDAGDYYYTRDHLGSIRELVDAGGTVRSRYQYNLWGQRQQTEGDLDTEEAFTGYLAHQSSGLLLSPTRLYAPSLGRFLARDPIRESGGMNLYAYVGGDPVNFTDPSGLAVNSLSLTDPRTLVFIFGPLVAAGSFGVGAGLGYAAGYVWGRICTPVGNYSSGGMSTTPSESSSTITVPTPRLPGLPGKTITGGMPALPGRSASPTGPLVMMSANNGEIQFPEGSFSIVDWTGYPAGLEQPAGPFRLLDGAEYDAARNAANQENNSIRLDQGLRGQPVDIHEIQPVKFGGPPTDPDNKVILDRPFHRQQVTPWWNNLKDNLTGK